MACSGVFGVPDTTRTCDPGLRRLVLYPTELLGHISKIFNFPPPTDSNELPLRRRPLYPTELRGLIQKIFNFTGLQDSNDSIFRRRSLYTTELQGHMQNYSIVQFRWTRDRRMLGGGPSILVRYGGMSLSILPHLSALVNSEKLLTQAARRPHIKNRPRAGLPGAGQNTAGGQRIRSADYVIPYHGIIGKRVLSKNIISARVTKYITYICSINPPKYSESMHITTLYAFCSSFQKKLFQNQLCPRRPDRKTKKPVC